MEAVIKVNGYDFKITDEDFIEGDGFIPKGEFNPHNVRPWMLHDSGFILCIVFAGNAQDAIDYAVDADKLDRYLVSEADLTDYGDEEEGITRLGNAGEPFDIESLGIIELINYPMSHVALMLAAKKESEAK